MSDIHEYIEDYFKQKMDDAEKKQFEERCVQDEEFAQQVALYITMEEGLRQKLLEQKRQQWRGNESKRENIVTPVKRLMIRKWMPYVAAACLIVVVVAYFLYRPKTPQQFANKYVKEHFTELSQTMNASNDSLQQGIAAYNNQEYNKALQWFEKISQSHPQDGVSKKYIGIVYLMTKDYDKALQQFEELAGMRYLYRNPGLFLKAITLLQRNAQGDKQEAKQLLEQVVNENAEGNREAKNWLEKW